MMVPFFRSSRIFLSSIFSMRALEKALSVMDRDLVPHVALGLVPHRLQAHRKQGDGHLLAGGDQHVVFPFAGKFARLVGQRDQLVGLPGHRRNDHHHVIAVVVGFGHAPGNIADPVDGTDRSPTILLHNQGHIRRV
jgi:hypothetical protein